MAGMTDQRMSWRMPRVLMYHNFGEAPPGGDPENLFLPVASFCAQLDLLRRRGWRALSLSEFVAALDGAPTPRKSYLITIDDGHESVLRTAAPILARAAIPSVLFVPPGILGGPVSWNPAYAAERLSGKAEIAALAGTPMEVGVHSYDHSRMVDMDAAGLHLQTERALAEVTEMMGYRPASFAYPFGGHDAKARAALAEAGFAVGFAVAREHGRFAVDRIYVKRTDTLPVFWFKLTLAYRVLSRVGGRLWRLRHAVRAVRELAPGSASPRSTREVVREGG
jgi:peptidoglycan/xylan/chitin deacetylase (PgdA/CDA1 family)